MTKSSKKKINFNTENSLDFLLSEILEQIKIVSPTDKDIPYSKLIELFFKGVDLKEKLAGTAFQDCIPQNNFIEGVEENLL
jgi:hypothetical protein